LFKASWEKKDVKQRHPEETPKTLMPLIKVQNQMEVKTLKEIPKTLMLPIGVQKPNGGKNLKGNP
jgi:hypothetical protein